MTRRGLQAEEFAAAAETARGEAQPIALQTKRDLELSEVVEIASTFVKVSLV
jgi:hypothetical protein